jgi:NADPH:quinone reductase-like Zn-dependent oxidoreductase/acyl carrier protein
MLCDLAETSAPLGAGHAERLSAAGFVDAAATRVASSGTPGWALSARAPARAGEPAEAAAPPLLVGFGGAGTLDDLTAGAAAVVHVGALIDAAATDASQAVAAGALALRDAARRVGPTGRLTIAAPGALTGAAPAAAALARVRRVMTNEGSFPPIAVLDPAPDLDQVAIAAAAAVDAEPERAISAAGWTAPRIAPAPDVAERAERAAVGAALGLALRPDAVGGLDTLRWRAVARRVPGPGEIEIAVAAAGLNFRDVMWAMGALPEEAIEDGFSGTGLGMECAGVVTRAGAGARLREGDAVVAFAAGALATHVTVAEDAAALLPPGADLVAWATLPVAFGTAWRGLADLGRLRSGETALIHGGAGGVGLAALQIARALGARALVTAGSPERRRLARALGAEAAFDSRGLAFADEIMAATGGRGVDVALNSLSGEAMERTLACLAPFGRFVELGKRDFYANTRIGLRPLRRNVSYFGVDLDAMLASRPDLGRQLLADVAERAAAGAFRPLPHQRFAADDAASAFRLMQRSGHVGKIVIAPPDAPEPVAATPPLTRAEGAYLVVGGARGFGARFAARLVARGARRRWLTSRSGRGDEAVIAAMREAGARVNVVACDAADEAAMTELLARIDSDGAPLRGAAHAAMALDDGLLEGLDAGRIAASLRPKLAGAAVLDRLTRDRPLDHFILFSSIAAWFGNPGQASYVAANAALESIAQGRRAAGLPALAAAFGPIADAGVLAEDAQARERLERKGAGTLSAEAALDALETALAGAGPADATLGIAPMRWGALAADLPIMASSLFSRLDLAADVSAAAGATSLASMLAGLDDAAAVAKLTALLRAEAAGILRQPVEEIDPARPLAELGFDSLMGMELKLSAEEKFGATMSGLSLADGATLRSLAARMVADLRGVAEASDAAPEITALVARHVGAERLREVAETLAAAAAEREGRAEGLAPMGEDADASR